MLFGKPLLLHATGTVPHGGVTLTFTIKGLTRADGSPFLASYDPSTGSWTPVASHYDSTLGTVSATIPHLSIWGVLSSVASGLDAIVKGALDSLTGAVKFSGPIPGCSGNDVTVTVSPDNGALNTCGQDAGASQVLVKVAGTLAFPLDLYVPNGSSTSLVPPADLYSDIAQALFDLTKAHLSGTVIPAGSEADVMLAIGPGQSDTMKSELDDVAYLTAIIYSGVQMLLLAESKFGSPAKETVTAVGVGTCAAQIAALPATLSLTAGTLKQLASIGFGCAEQIVDLGSVGFVSSVTAIVGSLFEDIVQTAFLTLETVVGWSTGGVYTITISRSAAPATAACSAPLLFQAAVTKEGFNPNDPSYSQLSADGEGPGAYAAACDDGWAVALISRPNVGETDGETLFQSQSGAWVEVAGAPVGLDECDLESAGVPATVATVLANGLKGSAESACALPSSGIATQASVAAFSRLATTLPHETLDYTLSLVQQGGNAELDCQIQLSQADMSDESAAITNYEQEAQQYIESFGVDPSQYVINYSVLPL